MNPDAVAICWFALQRCELTPLEARQFCLVGAVLEIAASKAPTSSGVNGAKKETAQSDCIVYSQL